MRWANISLEKFQLISSINGNPEYDELDKLLHTACVIFNKTERQLSTTKIKRVKRLIAKTSKLSQKPFPISPSKRIGYYFLNYNIESMRFGQYIELCYFLQKDTIETAHNILASISHLPFKKNNSNNHKKAGEYFLRAPISKAGGSVKHLIEEFSKFNKEYASLFDLPEDDEQAIEEEQSHVHPFNKTYGWIYSATMVAEHERITLDQAFDLPARQALNALSYLKSKKQYEDEQARKNEYKK